MKLRIIAVMLWLQLVKCSYGPFDKLMATIVFINV